MRGLWLGCLLVGCATAREIPRGAPPRTPALSEEAREPIVAAARSLVGKHFGDDCTGLVRAVFRVRSVDLLADAEPGDNGVTAIYRFALGRGRVFTGGHPLPGDLVFFHDTWDQNGDGRVNDGLTHVGLVESIDPDGTVSVIHRVQRGVVRYRMNLQHPSIRQDAKTGAVLNDYLRPKGRGPAVLTGQLFAAYATLFTRVEPVASAR